MNVSSIITNAYSGIQTQSQRLDKNVEQVASVEAASSHDTSTQDRALVEQIDIINSLRANAKSLQAASDRIGTLIDIKV